MVYLLLHVVEVLMLALRHLSTILLTLYPYQVRLSHSSQLVRCTVCCVTCIYVRMYVHCLYTYVFCAVCTATCYVHVSLVYTYLCTIYVLWMYVHILYVCYVCKYIHMYVMYVHTYVHICTVCCVYASISISLRLLLHLFNQTF